MIFEVGKEIIVPFLIVDASNAPVTSGVNPTCTIKKSDGKYWNGATSIWVDSIYNNLMLHSFKGVYVFSFTPQTEDFFIVRCSEPTYYKTEDGVAFRTVSRFTNLDNLDVLVSSRLSDVDFDNKIDIIDTNVDVMNLNVSNIKSTVDINLDTTVSSRSTVTESSIWGYNVRTNTPENVDGVGSCAVTIDVTLEGVASSGVTVMVYNSSRTVLLSAETDINGQVIFSIDPGNYYFEFKKESVAYSKEIKRTIPSVASINLDACIAW